MVTNEAQVESVLYGEAGAISGTLTSQRSISCIQADTNSIISLFFIALPYGASIILSSTVSPGYVSQLEQRLGSMSYRWFGNLLNIFKINALY